jgi:hypothetical protein
LFVPENFDITSLFGRFDAFSDVMHHNKYKNNFDYNLALFLLNKEPFLHNEFFILKESDQIQSRIGVIHWQRYTKQDEVIKFIETHKDSIQCVVSEVALPGAKTVGFGRSQCPGILDFADDTDTIQFLLSL